MALFEIKNKNTHSSLYHKTVSWITNDLFGLLGSATACPVAIKKKAFISESGSFSHVYTTADIGKLTMCPCTLYRTQQLELERLRKAQRRVGDFLKITFFMIHVKIFLVVIIITNHQNHYNNQSSDNSWVWGKKPKGGHLHLRGEKMIWRLCWLWWRGWHWYVLMIPGKKS